GVEPPVSQLQLVRLQHRRQFLLNSSPEFRTCSLEAEEPHHFCYRFLLRDSNVRGHRQLHTGPNLDRGQHSWQAERLRSNPRAVSRAQLGESLGIIEVSITNYRASLCR